MLSDMCKTHESVLLVVAQEENYGRSPCRGCPTRVRSTTLEGSTLLTLSGLPLDTPPTMSQVRVGLRGQYSTRWRYSNPTSRTLGYIYLLAPRHTLCGTLSTWSRDGSSKTQKLSPKSQCGRGPHIGGRMTVTSAYSTFKNYTIILANFTTFLEPVCHISSR